MKPIKTIFHFLGGVYLALSLILLAAIMVVLGTFIESLADSHLLAAQWTYHHPFFTILLGLFFVNILFSALRRWPFKWRHVPFLITHLGLLMVIGGTIIKNKKGLQGHLNLMEGSGSQSIWIPHSHALHIENKEQVVNFPLDITAKQTSYTPKQFPELSFKVIGYCPHVKEKMQTWIKGNYAYIAGQPPIPLQEWKEQDLLPSASQIILDSDSSPWDVIAIRTSEINTCIQTAYLHNLNVHLTSKSNPQVIINKPLKKLVNHSFSTDVGHLLFSLSLPYSSIKGFECPRVNVEWQAYNSRIQDNIFIPLQGNASLYNITSSDTGLAGNPFHIDLVREKPLLLIVEDEEEDIHLIAFDQYGRVHNELFCPTSLNSLVVYDEGFGGYAVQTQLPFPPYPSSRIDKIRANGKILANEIRQTLLVSSLTPPLMMLKNACLKANLDTADALVEFLTIWQQSQQLLFPKNALSPLLKQVFEQMDWDRDYELDKQACQWICLLFERLEFPIQRGENILKFLRKNRWPFLNNSIEDLSQIQPADLLSKLAQQIFAISFQLPKPKISTSTLNKKAKWLSALFKVHDIDYRILNIPYLEEEKKENFDLFKILFEPASGAFNWIAPIIETPLTIRYLPQAAPKKLEDRHSCLLLEICQKDCKERIALTYQATNAGLKWPILNGQYLLRYQPTIIEIPHRVRLREAREISYPDSQQPYSYESDILITELGKAPLAKTLSMNVVHETWDGYRFYLAGMNTFANTNAKQIQIVVNHDPAKYFLTYPGAVLVFIGTLLLFWLRPGKPKTKL